MVSSVVENRSVKVYFVALKTKKGPLFKREYACFQAIFSLSEVNLLSRKILRKPERHKKKNTSRISSIKRGNENTLTLHENRREVINGQIEVHTCVYNAET